MKESQIYAIKLQLDNIANNLREIETFTSYPEDISDEVMVMINVEKDRVVTALKRSIYSSLAELSNCKSIEEIYKDNNN